jgi:DNA-binding HxlR family transcriptional regulator
MPLPHTYRDQNCSIARALEVVGERWTLLIIRDAFYGVRRFGDFATQLGIPRAVLSSRLKTLVEEGTLAREQDEHATVEYRLTNKGERLWPVLRTLMDWGDDHYSPAGPKRVLRHNVDDGLLDTEGRCAVCGERVPLTDTRVESGPGFEPESLSIDSVSTALNKPRRLLEPLST